MNDATVIDKIRAAIELLHKEHPAGADLLLEDQKAPSAMFSYEVDGVKYALTVLAKVEEAILKNYSGAMVLYITDGGITVATIAPCEAASEAVAKARRKQFDELPLYEKHSTLASGPQMETGFYVWAVARGLLHEKKESVNLMHSNEEHLLRLVTYLGQRGVFVTPRMTYEPTFGEDGYPASFSYGTYLECRLGDTPPANPDHALHYVEQPAAVKDNVSDTARQAWEVAMVLHYIMPLEYPDCLGLYEKLLAEGNNQVAKSMGMVLDKIEELKVERASKAPPTYTEDNLPNPAYKEYYGLTQAEFERRVDVFAGRDMDEGQEVYSELDALIQAKIDAKDAE